MAEFETNLPNVRQVQIFIKNKNVVEVKLITNEILTGKLLWQDSDCLCITDELNQQIIIWRQSIAYLKLKSD